MGTNYMSFNPLSPACDFSTQNKKSYLIVEGFGLIYRFCSSAIFSHSSAEEAEATVQGERGGQEAQAAESPERGTSFRVSRLDAVTYLSALSCVQKKTHITQTHRGLNIQNIHPEINRLPSQTLVKFVIHQLLSS